jgi:hypothetical protein
VATVDSLRHQVAALREKIGKPGDPRHWIFALSGEQEIPEHIRAQIRDVDTVFIRRVMAEFFDLKPETCTVVTMAKRNYVVDMQSGQWREVTKSV